MSRIIYTSSQETPRKNKRWTKRKLIGAGTLFFICILLALAVYLVRLPSWQVHSIKISGTDSVDEEAVRETLMGALGGAYFFLLPKSSMALVNEEELERFLKNHFPRIAKADIEKEFPHTLRAAIQERQRWGIYCNDLTAGDHAQCAYIDTVGFAYEEAPRSIGSLIIKIRDDGEAPKPVSQVISQKKAERMQRIATLFHEKLEVETVGFELLSKIPREIRLVSTEGFKIIFDHDADVEHLANTLYTIFNEEIKNKRNFLEYIDARFGNKVFYKLKE